MCSLRALQAKCLTPTAGAGASGGFRGVSYNPAENAVLLTTDHDGGSYELFSIPKDANGSSVVTPPATLCISCCCR